MLRVGFVLAALSAGCFSTPAFHGTGDASGSDAGGSGGDGGCSDLDAPPAVVKTDAAISCTWGLPVVLPGDFHNDVSGQPTMNAAMTLLVWDYGPSGSTNDLHYATRAPADETWTVFLVEPFDTGDNTADMDPTLNDAGDDLFFLSNTSGARTIYETRHSCAGWSDPQPINTQVTITDVVGIDTVGDGNTLYIAFSGGELLSLARVSKEGPFVSSPSSAGSHALFPGVSPDELSVYQARFDGYGIDHYTRSSKTSAFSSNPAEHLFGTTETTDADILADGVHMVVALDRVTVGVSTCQ